MIQLPKIKRNPTETEHFCKCRPLCKSRRREWKGEIQKTSAELLLERKPQPECFRRWPMEIYENGPCPLRRRTKRVTVVPRGGGATGAGASGGRAVRLCQAPLDLNVDKTYLHYAELAKNLGAWDAVRTCCAFCSCGACCACAPVGYHARDAERATHAARRADMAAFDHRVKTERFIHRIMYNNP